MAGALAGAQTAAAAAANLEKWRNYNPFDAQTRKRQLDCRERLDAVSYISL
jgi:hypothetical protein